VLKSLLDERECVATTAKCDLAHGGNEISDDTNFSYNKLGKKLIEAIVKLFLRPFNRVLFARCTLSM